MDAKSNINEVNIFLLFREKFKINTVINGGKPKINVVNTLTLTAVVLRG
jgi:hypothetical protein